MHYVDGRASRRPDQVELSSKSLQLAVEQLFLIVIELSPVRVRNMLEDDVVVPDVESFGAHRHVHAQRPLVFGAELRLELEQRVELCDVQLFGHLHNTPDASQFRNPLLSD